MNQRDLSELRRRLNPDKRRPSVIRGCYADMNGQIISTFVQPIHHLPAEENEKYMALFKRVLSGTQGQSLQEVDFSTEQVLDGANHKLLTVLRESGLTDEEAVSTFYEHALDGIRQGTSADAQSVSEQQNACHYLILLLHDGYDIAYQNAAGETDNEQSTDMFSYILCCVCPVKQTKPALSYFASESAFHNRLCDWVVAAPQMGFLFPAYEERSANISRALFYTNDAADMHDAFIQSVFGADLPTPAPKQQEVFQAILQESLAEECSLEVVQAIHETVRTRLEEQKADKNAEPLKLTKEDVAEVMQGCGVSEEKTEAFAAHYADTFGDYAQIPAVNTVEPKQFLVTTPSVSIRVDPKRSDLIETRVIDGRCYILVLADGDVEVNGVQVKFQAE